MPPGDMVLIDTSSVARIFPAWWMPSAENLAAIAPAQTHVKVRAVAVDDERGADLSTATSLWVAVDEVDGEILKGTITVSSINEEGSREGDRLETTTGRVWDFFQVGNDGEPELNQDRANAMLGKTAQVRITEEARSRQKPPTQSQVAGTIENTDSKGIRLRLRDGSTYNLPPDIRSSKNALPARPAPDITDDRLAATTTACLLRIAFLACAADRERSASPPGLLGQGGGADAESELRWLLAVAAAWASIVGKGVDHGGITSITGSVAQDPATTGGPPAPEVRR